MRKAIIMAAAASLIVQVACKRPNDVLAEYKGGKITRGELYEWLTVRNMPPDMIKKKKSQQKSKLEQMAVERIVVSKARSEGLEDSADYKYILAQGLRTFYATYLGKKILKDPAFRQKAAKTRIIKLMVRDYRIENGKNIPLTDAEREEAFGRKLEKAAEIIKEIQKGEPFEEQAKKYSDDFSRSRGGDIGYYIRGMREDEFSDAVFALKEGKYSTTPVRTPTGVYVILVEELVDLNEKNIEDYIKDRMQASGIKRRLATEGIRAMQKKLVGAKDVEDLIGKNIDAGPSAVLFRVGDMAYTGKDLADLIGFLQKKRSDMGYRSIAVDSKIKKEMALRVFREELFRREAVRRKIDQDPRFKKDLLLFKDYNLARFYTDMNVLAKVSVTEAEVRKEYDINRDRTYARIDDAKGGQSKRVIPYSEVRESIEARLQNARKSAEKKKWESELLKGSGFIIHNSELEGD